MGTVSTTVSMEDVWEIDAIASKFKKINEKSPFTCSTFYPRSSTS